MLRTKKFSLTLVWGPCGTVSAAKVQPVQQLLAGSPTRLISLKNRNGSRKKEKRDETAMKNIQLSL